MINTRVRLRPEELERFEQDVQNAARKYPEIVRIRHAFDEDWDGDPAIYFYVVLSDDAAKEDRLGEITSRIRDEMPRDLGLTYERFPHFRFRSKAEEDVMRSPEWS